MKSYLTIDEYLVNFSGEPRNKLDQLRQLVKQLAPDAKEKISYGIPTFTWHGNLVHFAGYDKHIGFYPGSFPIAELQAELKGYVTSRGTVQFPLDKPLPMNLIRKLTELAIERNTAKKK